MLRTHLGNAAFLSLLALIPVPDACAEEGLISRWQFDAEHVQGDTLKADAGPLDAKIVGPVRFSENAPEVLILEGNSQAKQRVSVNLDVAREVARLESGAAGPLLPGKEVTDVAPPDDLDVDDVEATKESRKAVRLLPKKAITVEAWARVETPQDWGGIIGVFQDNGSYERGWVLGYNRLGFTFGIATQKAKRLTYLPTRSVYAPGYWYHVAGTYDGVEQRIYLDGNLEGIAKAQGGNIVYSPKSPYTLGAYHDDNELHSMAGRLDQVSVYDRALTADEVREHFEARKGLFPGILAELPKVSDWPTYMRDNQRTGLTEESLKFPLRLKWVYSARHAPKPAWPRPASQDFWHNKPKLDPRVTYDRAYHVVSVGDVVVFGSSADDKVYCLDAESGRQRWSYFTEGPVRLAPAIAQGKVLFGSDDGVVYCLGARTGSLQWKVRLGPDDRRLPGNERIISAWPVRTGVLVEGNLARVCAGLFPGQGLFQGAIDIRSGKKVSGGPINVPVQGYTARRGGRFHAATGRVPAGAFIGMLERRGKDLPREALAIPARYPYAFIGAGNVRLVGGEGKIAAFSIDDASEVWSANIEGRAYSLAAARGRLLISTDAGRIYCFSSDAAEPRVVESPEPKGLAYPTSDLRNRYAEAAKWISEKTGVDKGYALVLGSSEGRLAYELAKRTSLKIVCVEPDAGKVAASRTVLDAAGLYGRVVVHQLPPGAALPYRDCVFNLVTSDSVALGGGFPGSRDEAERVLRPYGGVAVSGLSGGQVVRRGVLEGAGEWTHMYADPGNTACSGDRRVTGRLALQWFGRPGPRSMVDRHHRTVPPLCKNGTLFIPGNDRIIAADAYNGTVLWNVEVPNSRRVAAFRDCGYMAADADHVLVASANRCLGLNPRTGAIERIFHVDNAPDGQKCDWGYVATSGRFLFGSGVRPGASRRELSKKAIAGAYYDFRPIVCSDFLFALDQESGRKQWDYRPESGSIINPTIAIGDGRVFFTESTAPGTANLPTGRAPLPQLLPNSSLVALDMQTGKTLWREGPELGAIQHNLYLSYSRGCLAVVGSRNSSADRKTATVMFDIHVFDAKTGAKKWSHSQDNQRKVGGSHGEQDLHPVIVGDRLYCEPYAYELDSGRPVSDWGWDPRGRRGCGSISASASALFFRNANPMMLDLKTSQYHKLTTVTRPGCWISLIPAGGLLLAPEASSGCTCNYAIQTSLAFLPIETHSPSSE